MTLAGKTPAEGGGASTACCSTAGRYDTGKQARLPPHLVQFACERSDLAEEIVPWLRK